MISDAFLNKMFYINILILIAFTKQMLNLMYLYILIWKRQVATNDIKSHCRKSIVAKCDQIRLLPNNHSFKFMSAATHYTKETK